MDVHISLVIRYMTLISNFTLEGCGTRCHAWSKERSLFRNIWFHNLCKGALLHRVFTDNANLTIFVLTIDETHYWFGLICWYFYYIYEWTSSYPWSPNLCPEAVVDCVGKPRIFIQYSCLIAPRRGYVSALWRTRMLLPNDGSKIAD